MLIVLYTEALEPFYNYIETILINVSNFNTHYNFIILVYNYFNFYHGLYMEDSIQLLDYIH